jgi:hypothetical protein
VLLPREEDPEPLAGQLAGGHSHFFAKCSCVRVCACEEKGGKDKER